MKRMEAQLAELQAAKSAAESKAKDAEIVLRKQKLDAETFNVLLSSWDQKRTDLPSQGGLDIYVANSATQLCSAIEQHGDGFGRPVAWIPVLLYPQLLQDGSYTNKAGAQVPKYKLGQTVANESFAVATVVDPTTGKKSSVSLTCYATISVNVDPSTGQPTDPTKLHEKLEKAIEKDDKARRYNNGDPDNDPEIPAFIGYMQSQGLAARLAADRPAAL
jgi:hypothetical protein